MGMNLSSEASETLGGWLLEKMGRIPAEGELFQEKKLEFTIKKATLKKILKVGIQIKP